MAHWLQGATGSAAAAVRCESSNGTLLQLVCASPTPTTATRRASPSCDLPVPAAGGVVVTLVAMEDFDNEGPAVKAACLVCTGPPGLGSRAAAVNVEITNVVRPIVGDADFAEGGNKSEARSVLRGGALSISRRKWVAAESACPTHPLYRLQAKVPLRSSPVAEGCSRCARTQLSASSRHQLRSRCPHSCKQSSLPPHSSRLAAAPSVPGCPHIWTHCRRAETRCALSSAGPPNPV